ncbi:MAG: TraR/DksA family transcriptional regulator [Parachlamydiales bacterium]|jgi:DnaK suppressor protein
MPLNKKEVEKFKERLVQMRRQITHSIQGTKEEVKELDQSKGYSQHQADEGTDDFGRTVSLELSNKELFILKQIDRALEKIADGTYGVCDISGEEIARARLEAIPYAVMTVKSQEMMEKGLIE